MKFAQQKTFVVLLLGALLQATSATSSSSPKEAPGFISKRRLEEEDFDFGEWTGNFFDNVMDAIGFGEDNDDGSNDSGLDLCSIVELAIGMGSQFGVEANCGCDGDMETGLELTCNYDQCAPGASDVCGTVDLKFEFGGSDGNIVDMTACSDFAFEQFQTTCFSYRIDQSDGSNNGFGFSPTCEATYGGNQCDCDIEANNICMTIDCTRFFPGAKIDTCQVLSMVDESDMENWFPNFDAFQPGFELQAEDIPWATLDFKKMDFDNFDIGAVQWLGDDEGILTSTWIDLIGDNPTFLDAEGISPGVCTLLYQAANITENLGIDGSCTCGYNEAKDALELSCGFSESCVTTGASADPLCGSVTMNLTYGSLAEIYTDVCIQYSQFPQVCYSYGIPFAEDPIPDLPDRINDDLNGVINNNSNYGNGLTIPLLRDCSARYGGDENNCKCSMDENFCMTVDCTDFEPLAITDNCQVIDLKGATEDNSSSVVLNFRPPGEDVVVSDGEGGEFVPTQQQGPIESSAASTSLFAAAMAVAISVTLG